MRVGDKVKIVKRICDLPRPCEICIGETVAIKEFQYDGRIRVNFFTGGWCNQFDSSCLLPINGFEVEE